MSNHVSEWLNAYFDGELTGKLSFRSSLTVGTLLAFEQLAMLLTRMTCPPDRNPAHIEQRDRNLYNDLG